MTQKQQQKNSLDQVWVDGADDAGAQGVGAGLALLGGHRGGGAQQGVGLLGKPETATQEGNFRGGIIGQYNGDIEGRV